MKLRPLFCALSQAGGGHAAMLASLAEHHDNAFVGALRALATRLFAQARERGERNTRAPRARRGRARRGVARRATRSRALSLSLSLARLES